MNFSEVLNLVNLGVNSACIKFGVRTKRKFFSHRDRFT